MDDTSKHQFALSPTQQTIPDRLEEFVQRYPSRIAFKSKKETLTWDTLNQSANRVARAILGMCESRDRPIALLVDQGASIIASFGVLKTAGFYVPLTPSHPSARNSYILKESEATLIVTDNKNSQLAPTLAGTDCQILNIDALDSSLSVANLGLPISPDSFTYITYTSGSTGEPKGVINTHRKVLQRIAHDREFQLGPDDRFTNVGSAERNAFSALLSGAGSFPWYVREDGLAHLAEWLIQQEITVFRSGPRVFRQFASTLTGAEQFPKLRVINLTGAPAHRGDVDLYKKHFSTGCLLVNTLGTHEVGPFRMYVIGSNTKITEEVIPVGYEIQDKEVLLLDDNGQDVGFNRPGEIAVKSRHLSPGYWRRPDLTKTKFLEDPSGGDRRIYLTGDLGTMSPDGCLKHLGRKDFQAKIRGFRVDVSEVEKALVDHSCIKEATVTIWDDQWGDPQLVAYFVPSGGSIPTVSSLRNFLKQKLPDYMIPVVFVKIDEIPLTTTGTAKVDRRALPAPDHKRPHIDTPFIESRTAVEKELSQIWSEILSLDRVGIHDNFFDLGGHSLAATRVVAQVIRKFQLEIPLQTLFRAQTVAGMAAVIAQNQGKTLDARELEGILSELESLSDDDAKKLLAKQDATGSVNKDPHA